MLNNKITTAISAMLVALATSACVTSKMGVASGVGYHSKDLARPEMPENLSRAEADQLYEAQRIVCVKGKCDRNGSALDLSALPPGGSYKEVNHAYDNKGMLKLGLYSTSGTLAAISTVLLSASLTATTDYSTGYGYGYYRDTGTQDDLTVASIVTGVAAIIPAVIALALSDDAEKVADAYNMALKQDIEKRVANNNIAETPELIVVASGSEVEGQ